ncbi:MAG: TetR/AcrR family transcriptional regulator [Oscillospiraceae bacterium]|nr:TetR/AcrR family transcriptional regulator [Oscillospiraceae bacterium]MBQ3560991.1 TetR/AcrR family transcriptional regulator [Oscillospiraceae bacterium]MBQ4118100.1 TetR/AcrR family transcriptional regulator [Oscillospiraceae bacterium]MBQ6699572.1 TetR/AcrR family transcriptional regulator [Oscillospiraceae bacterium]MBQ6802967.1 TetR/AcrR family transcriptional regulator [Oscillospiraceae bacterium]
MAGKYKEISDQTRQNFIDAFWQLYEKKDINKIKVQEICDIAGYHRNTFYHYFSDVYDVLGQIEDRIINELIENSDGQMYSREKTAEIFSKIYMKHKKYLCVLADEKYKSGFPEKMKNILRPFCNDIYRYSSDDKNEYILEYKLSGTIAAIMHYFKSNDDFPLEELLNLIVELVASGKWPIKSR